MSGFYSDRSINKDFSAKTVVVLDAIASMCCSKLKNWDLKVKIE